MRWVPSVRGAFDNLFDLYGLAGPQGKAALRPVIFSRIVDWRKKSKRATPEERKRVGARIAEYNKEVRKANTA